jgi:hypothetical protein
MSRLAEIYRIIGVEPLRVIEFVWALGLICNGLYLLTPDYAPAKGSVLVAFVGSPEVAIGVAILYIVSGAVALWAAYRNSRKIRNVSTWLMFAAFTFTAILRLLTVGFVPTIWVWPLLLGLTAIVINIHLNWKRFSP